MANMQLFAKFSQSQRIVKECTQTDVTAHKKYFGLTG